MKHLYIVANWKSNKTALEAEEWLTYFKNQFDQNNIDFTNKEIIICPSFQALTLAKQLVDNLKIPTKIGAQNISSFGPGAYTGEISGEQLAGIVQSVIIGHSERRINFAETDEILNTKTQNAIKYNLTPIFCVQNENIRVPQGVKIVAYEPVEAIGTGVPDTPENADKVASLIKQKNKEIVAVLYGGSVTSNNVNSFTSTENISGVLVGGASLDPAEFFRIIKNA